MSAPPRSAALLSAHVSYCLEPDEMAAAVGRGYLKHSDSAAAAPLMVLQRHPALGLLAATVSYCPSYFPIWGNGRTFSWEPYLERTVPAGSEEEWSVDYEFPPPPASAPAARSKL